MNYHLDARRLLCPLPVIRLQDKIKELLCGDIITVVCTDPGTLNDIPAWCRVHGHIFLGAEGQGHEIMVKVQVQK